MIGREEKRNNKDVPIVVLPRAGLQCFRIFTAVAQPTQHEIFPLCESPNI
jgi:hypothetical protein